MPLFVCDKCKCVDNTALGHYWGSNQDFFDDEFKGMAFCNGCAPPKYKDGTINRDSGEEWHNHFPKQSVEDFLKEYPDAKNDILNYDPPT